MKLCATIYDGIPRDGGAVPGTIIRCDLTRGHAGDHIDHAFDAPSILVWSGPVRHTPEPIDGRNRLYTRCLDCAAPLARDRRGVWRHSLTARTRILAGPVWGYPELASR